MASGCRFEWRPHLCEKESQFHIQWCAAVRYKIDCLPWFSDHSSVVLKSVETAQNTKASFCRDSPKYEGARNGFDWSPPWHSKKGNPKSTHPSRNILHLRSQCNCFGGLLLISTDSPDSSKAKMYGFTRRQKRFLHNQQYWQCSTYNRRESTRLVGKCRPPKHLANSPGKIPATLIL